MKNSDNYEFCIAIECINNERKNILLIIILIRRNLLISHFYNDINDNVLFTTLKTDYLND
jgi:hypothetical protein